MKYKAGDRVKVKSHQWFNENFNDDYNVVFADGRHFSEPMSIFCSKEFIIERISHATNPPHYIMKDNIFACTEEMIEGLVEEENTLSKNAKLVSERFAEYVNPSEFKHSQDTIMKMLLQGAINLPEDYQFVDENGNVINATKIVLEKKKKEYPKTYEECCKVLGYSGNYNMILTTDVDNKLFNALYRLKVCRDAYWKIAGEEMGLGKPWEPDWKNEEGWIHCITNDCDEICCTGFRGGNKILAFPTEEMRDAFKENFDPDIEICKELL